MPKVKKTTSVVHPNSRKALQLARQMFHSEKLEKRKEEANTKQKLKLTKFKWFKENADFSKNVYSASDVQELIQRYLNRFEKSDTTDETKSLKRHLSSSTFHDYKTKFFVEKEIQEFETQGIEMPNVMQKRAYDSFKEWNGDAQLLPAIDTVKISKKQLEKLALNAKENTDVSDHGKS